MAKQGISTGTNPNDGTGDSLLTGAVKINGNFDELYTYLGNGSSLNYIGGRWSNTSIGINTLSNVGVGTTNPTSALTVTGDGKVTGVVTATTFIGNVTGAVTGNVVGNVTGDVTGTATTATKATQLLGSRTIGGVVFDNTGNINLPGVNAAGNQNTTGTAAGLTGTPNITVGIATVGTALSFADDKEDVVGETVIFSKPAFL